MTIMTRVTSLIIAVIAAIAMLSGCKTSEANYRAAYQAAKEKSDENSGIDDTIYDRIRKEAISSRLIVGTDSIPLSTVNVRLTEGCGTPEQFKPYSIVVNQFKQVFNAKSLMNRLRDNGHNAIVVETAEPLYYVIAGSYETAEEAAAAYHKIKSDKNIVLKEPFPWILRPVRLPGK